MKINKIRKPISERVGRELIKCGGCDDDEGDTKRVCGGADTTPHNSNGPKN